MHLAFAFLSIILATVPAGAGPNDTAGRRLREVWTEARKKHGDSILVSISGKTGGDGNPVCDTREPMQMGWRYTFYSPKADSFLMMAACEGEIAGPLTQLGSGSEAKKRGVSGIFIDSDQVFKTLLKSGVPLNPAAHGENSRRPYLLKLSRLADERFKTHPAVWVLTVGRDSYIVDAVANERFDPARYGVSLSVDESTATLESSPLDSRPKRPKIYTAKTDLKKVLDYARENLASPSLMAVESIVDAWGASPCTGPGDGWAFYFYSPRTKDYEAVFSCNGYVGPGPLRYIPVDMKQHKPIDGRFIDSDRAVDQILTDHPDVMNEGMGRMFSRTGTLLLRNFRSPPHASAALMDTTLIWDMTLGRTRFRVDARTGKLIDVR